jgi:hypothetical protein
MLDPMIIVGAVIVIGVLALLILFFGGLIGLGTKQSRMTAEVPDPAWDEDAHRVLVLLTTDCVDERVCREITDRRESVDIRVAVPLQPSRLDYYVVGTDEDALPVAERRLETALGHLHARGVNATGALGEISAGPVEMIQDEAAAFRPHEVVLVIDPEERQTWMEHTLVKDAASRYDIPLTVLHAHSVSA